MAFLVKALPTLTFDCG